MKYRSLRITTAVLFAAGAAVTLPNPSKRVDVAGFWWENPISRQEVPAGLKTLRAAECGTCHVEIYREWRASIHAHALSDLQFQAEMAKDPGSGWLCLNCHIPLENQRETIAIEARGGKVNQPALARNPNFDPVLRDEAITCAVCHVRDAVVLGPWGDSKAPHAVRKSATLTSAEFCTSCHQAIADYGETLVCRLDTGNEWSQTAFADAGVQCADCHMPKVSRPAAEGGPVRRVALHVWAGSRIHKELDVPEEHRQLFDTFEPALRFSIETDLNGYSPGDTAKVTLRMSNTRAGHMLPTGDVERFLTIDLEGVLPDGATFGKQTYRIGQQWEWYPEVKQLDDNRLRPQESRTQTYDFELPRTKGAVEFRATATHHRISVENAKYHDLLGKYPLSAPIGETTKSVVVRGN
jgi:hypothetical protein